MAIDTSATRQTSEINLNEQIILGFGTLAVALLLLAVLQVKSHRFIRERRREEKDDCNA